jgi:membrane associated rhomboid family serine protease
MVERIVVFSWNSGWYDSIVDGLVYTYVMTNNVIKAEDRKNHLYKVIEWISAGKENSKYVKKVKLDIDYSKEVVLEDFFSKLLAFLIAIGLAGIGLSMLIQSAGGPAALGGLIGGGIILLILLLLILREVR